MSTPALRPGAAGGARVRGRRVRRLGVALLALACSGGAVACGGPSPAEQDPCTQYADVADALADLQQLDPSTASADEVASAAGEVQVQLDQLQAVSEQRYDAAVSLLRSTVTAVEQSLAVSAGVSPEQVAQQVDEAMTAVVEAWAPLVDSLGGACGTQ
ncbi:hypothetical protein ACTHAM_002574 [Cellulomonas soli]|uniref:hypothetical protein n=1 Tax=Cellulomonas soli TaxID=931535 RepID=UPI003F83D58A